MTNFRALALLSVPLCLVSFLASGCTRKETPGAADTARTSTASSRPVPGFDAGRAMQDVRQQMSFGPRVPNTTAHDKAVEYYRQVLSGLTEHVELQSFDSAGYNGAVLHLTNIVASFNPAATQRVLLLTHFDSRPWSDQDPVKSNRSKPVPAANDGASGTAVLLELARQFKASPPPIGVDILLDDGEDYGIDSIDHEQKYFIGVKHFVSTRAPGFHPALAILLDMVGDKNAVFRPEPLSMQSAPDYVNLIWETARNMNLSHFNMTTGPSISDDHVPLVEVGIPSVDIIDGDLVGHADPSPDRKYWHTTDDVESHLSADTMAEVGKLLLTLIYDRLPRTLSPSF
jgi:glutaminyl-peptide cyclotransferase